MKKEEDWEEGACVNPEILCGRLLSHEKHNGHGECDVRRREGVVFGGGRRLHRQRSTQAKQRGVCGPHGTRTGMTGGEAASWEGEKKAGKKVWAEKAVDGPNDEQQRSQRGLVCPLRALLTSAAPATVNL